MNGGELLDLWREALWTTAMVGGPFIVTALAVGLLVALLQAATQLQENILTFAPKLLSVGLVMALAGQSLLGQLTRFTEKSAATIVTIGRRSGR